jgi:acetyltransferase
MTKPPPQSEKPIPPLNQRRSRLETMLSPRVIALIGATERQKSAGRTIMENLLLFGGSVYPINPKRSNVLGVKAFARIELLGEDTAP